MRIKNIICVKGVSGYFFDDQKAVKTSAKADGEFYIGEAVTKGFSKVRQPGECVSVMLIMESGAVAIGDCCAVQYSGAGGRDDLFRADKYIDEIKKYVTPKLVGEKVDSFKRLAKLLDNIRVGGKRLHKAITYGFSQALLKAVALTQHNQMAQVVANEYDLEIDLDNPPKILAQSGDNRYLNTDKMLIKRVDTLPHALFNTVDKIGKKGEKLEEYVGWLRERVKILNDKNYMPTFHIDVYGTVGQIFDNDIKKVAKYLEKLADIAQPHKLYVEGPIDTGDRESTLEKLSGLVKILDKNKKVKIVADEWCNTLEDIKEFADKKAAHMIQIKTPDLGSISNSIKAVLYCKEKGVEAYLGGTCNETDQSARVCVHIAIATAPHLIMSKPGMGVDEGLMITRNELNRTLAVLKEEMLEYDFYLD
ncbi:MAG: methylaspartate ammonia-lyase [Firmicutes bacterium]|nr:methylaspartate ammonia-lyase [Bacillota bacterium]